MRNISIGTTSGFVNVVLVQECALRNKTVIFSCILIKTVNVVLVQECGLRNKTAVTYSIKGIIYDCCIAGVCTEVYRVQSRPGEELQEPRDGVTIGLCHHHVEHRLTQC